mmetsp:Transcript_50162/g.160552  ORF Transcript_50162/g.160552 Transcript_50162/m.160552 type:complete len:302 (-) Transcript_50162:1321-2226(-)
MALKRWNSLTAKQALSKLPMPMRWASKPLACQASKRSLKSSWFISCCRCSSSLPGLPAGRCGWSLRAVHSCCSSDRGSMNQTATCFESFTSSALSMPFSSGKPNSSYHFMSSPMLMRSISLHCATSWVAPLQFRSRMSRCTGTPLFSHSSMRSCQSSSRSMITWASPKGERLRSRHCCCSADGERFFQTMMSRSLSTRACISIVWLKGTFRFLYSAFRERGPMSCTWSTCLSTRSATSRPGNRSTGIPRASRRLRQVDMMSHPTSCSLSSPPDAARLITSTSTPFALHSLRSSSSGRRRQM